MLMVHVKYKPNNDKLLRSDHWEVWTGLPTELEFERVPARNPAYTGMRAEGDGVYIWVMPDAVTFLDQFPQADVLALGSRSKYGSDFLIVKPSVQDPLEFAIEENARKESKLV
jgi:hypothetical protein